MKESLCRSRKNRIFGGVAAGLGEYLKMDPVIIRVLFVLSVFLSGLGILLYIILWIVVPEENIYAAYGTPPPETTVQEEDIKTEGVFTNEYIPKKNSNGTFIIGVLLVLAGLFFLGVEIFSFLHFTDLFPIAAIGVGIGLIYNSLKNGK